MIGIIGAYARALYALVVVPTDEIDRIFKIIPVGTGVAAAVLVPAPGVFFSLGIAVGIRRAKPGDDTENIGAWRLGFGVEAGIPGA